MVAERRDERGRTSANLLAILLIGVGVVWLLGQFNILSAASLSVLVRFWPLILVAIGINLLVGRGSPQFSLLIGAVTIIVLLALMVLGPSLGLAQDVEVKTVQFSEPLTGAESAEIRLDLSVGQVTVEALSDSNELIAADLRYLGDVRFDRSGAGVRRVHLYTEGAVSGGTFSVPLLPWLNFGEPDLRWDIGLSPDVPLRLNISGGVGRSVLDLRELQLTSLDLNTGVGETTLMLPATQATYTASIDSGVGQVNITIDDGAALSLTINGGVGQISIDIPDDAPVRFEARGGLGDVNVSGTRLNIVRQGDDVFEYETESYTSAGVDERISILVNGGIGGVRVR